MGADTLTAPPATDHRAVIIFTEELLLHEAHDLTVTTDGDVYCLMCEKVLGADVA
jgi:hypothetical protein